ncbi:MAG TPA: hypothetical protein VFA09_22010 [Ktedonobacteraceae bacterium]|jgi:hypothetical protein|nr:hypothetical protein [Ktedonobacteraceae bacterium]
MLDLAELTWGRYNSGQIAPAGSYLNLRTLCIFQQASDGTMPADGTFFRVDPSGTQTFANIATTVNSVLGTSYTAASFHACAGGDNETSPGQASDDA